MSRQTRVIWAAVATAFCRIGGGRSLLALLVLGLGIAGAWQPVRAQTMPHDMAHHGADGTGHDEVNMPGLQGLDATAEESGDLATMFQNFPKITRTVENLPNGIRTVTYSEDEEVMFVVVRHILGMINRVEEGRDPKVFIQSPTLDILFERRERIETQMEMTPEGMMVIQTSDDPDVVAALHKHAGEVSAMVDRGMQAVHEMMMERQAN